MEAVITDVFSYLMKPKDTRGDAYRPHVKGKTVAVSFITVGELYHWAEKRKWSAKSRQNLEERLKAVVVVPYDAELCRTYGRVRASLPTGFVVAANDLWIAACAIRHAITLITNNRKHFERIPGLTIISEMPAKTAPIPVSGDLFKSIKTETGTVAEARPNPDLPRVLLVEDESQSGTSSSHGCLRTGSIAGKRQTAEQQWNCWPQERESTLFSQICCYRS